MTNDPYDLQRFVDAQNRIYDTAVDELVAGRKRSHWMWFVFPQLRGLGSSPTAVRFGISSIRSADEIFGWPDEMKLRSSMTLFARAADDNDDFVAVLQKFYGGEEDSATLSRLS